jgi:hypothetical protein
MSFGPDLDESYRRLRREVEFVRGARGNSRVAVGGFVLPKRSPELQLAL